MSHPREWFAEESIVAAASRLSDSPTWDKSPGLGFCATFAEFLSYYIATKPAHSSIDYAIAQEFKVARSKG